MNRRNRALVLFAITLLAQTAFNVTWHDEYGDPYSFESLRAMPRIGAWSWAFYRQSNDEIIAHARSFGLNFLYLSIPTVLSSGERARVLDLIAKCKLNDIDLYWMTCEDFAPYFNHTANLAYIDRVLDFLEAENVSIPGIHIDLEPDISGDYELRSAKFNDYLVLLSEMKALVDSRLGTSRNFTLSAAICNCYHDPANIANGSAAIMHQYLDFLVPMTYYCSNPFEYQDLIDPLIPLAPVVIGVGYTTYKDYNALVRILNATVVLYQDNPNFLGFSIFHDELIASP
jgi:hypothetical protein